MKAKYKEIVEFNNGELMKYNIYELVQDHDSILKTPTQEFDFKNPPIDPYTIAYSMAKTMIRNNGIGLSCNQIGLPYRIFSMSLVDQSTPKTHNVITLFNPKVLEYSEETVMSEEGCLSYPNLFLKVSRPKSVKLQYCLADEIETVKTFYGLQARIVLHELDHLEGKLFTDSVGPTSLRLARARRNKRRKNSQAA